MIFKKDNIIYQILDVFYYKDALSDTHNPKRAFDTLSYNLHADMTYDVKKDYIKIDDHTICYNPGSVTSTCHTITNESIAVHFKVYNYSSDIIETFLPANYQKYEKLFADLLDCWTKKRFSFKYEAASILNSIFIEFNKDCKPDKEQNAKISAAIQYIDENIFNTDFSLSIAAKKSMISDTYFRQIFHQEYKMSPKKYVISKRMEYASSLIMMGYYSLQEISGMCGYSDYKHFSVEFKKHFGLSPSQYYYPPDKKA